MSHGKGDREAARNTLQDLFTNCAILVLVYWEKRKLASSHVNDLHHLQIGRSKHVHTVWASSQVRFALDMQLQLLAI